MCITAPKFDMDDVWSIKKNVSANGGLLNSTDGLNLKANSTYYSRYGGIKGRCRTRGIYLNTFLRYEGEANAYFCR